MKRAYCLVAIFAVLACVAHMGASTALAQAEKSYIDTTLSDSELLKECQDHFYPTMENRVLSDIPLQVMWMKVGGDSWSLTPIAGLDVYGLWLTPIHMNCKLIGAGKAVPEREGHQLHLVLSANLGIAAPGRNERLDIATPDPSNPGMSIIEEEEIVKRDLGGMVSATLGVYWDWRYKGGGHYNRLQIGALLRPGYYFGDEQRGFAIALGVGIVISPRDD